MFNQFCYIPIQQCPFRCEFKLLSLTEGLKLLLLGCFCFRLACFCFRLAYLCFRLACLCIRLFCFCFRLSCSWHDRLAPHRRRFHDEGLRALLPQQGRLPRGSTVDSLQCFTFWLRSSWLLLFHDRSLNL